MIIKLSSLIFIRVYHFYHKNTFVKPTINNEIMMIYYFFVSEEIREGQEDYKDRLYNCSTRPECNMFMETLDVDVTHIFTVPCIVEESQVNEVWMDEDFKTPKFDLIEEALERKWHMYTLEEMINVHKWPVVLSGIGGHGKSFMTYQAACEWAVDQLWTHFIFVFYLRCNELNFYIEREDYNSVYDLIRERYPPYTRGIDDDSFACMGDRICVILDGIEDLEELDNLMNNPEPKPCTQSILDLLMGVNNHCVIVVGRPEVTLKIREMMSRKRPVLSLVLLGFTLGQSLEYIEKHFVGAEEEKEHENRKRLETILQRWPYLESLTRMPLLHKITTCLFVRAYFSDLPRTSMEVCIYLIVYFAREHMIIDGHHMNNHKWSYYMFEEEVMNVLFALGRIAFVLLQRGDSVIAVEEISHEEHYKHYFSSGFMTLLKINGKDYAVFPHRFFMDMLAAIHMKNMGMRYPDLEFFHYTEVMRMYIGLEGISANYHKDRYADFISNIDKTVEQPSRIRSMLAAKKTCIITSMCQQLQEENSSKDSNTVVFDKDNEHALYFLSTIFEYRKISPKQVSPLKAVTFHVEGISRFDLINAAYFFGQVIGTNVRMEMLNFENCSNVNNVNNEESPTELDDVFRLIPHFKEVSFQGCQLNLSTLELIVAEIHGPHYVLNLSLLDLSSCDLNDAKMQAIASCIPLIKSVNLSGNLDITLEGYEALVRSIDSEYEGKNQRSFDFDTSYVRNLMRRISQSDKSPFKNMNEIRIKTLQVNDRDEKTLRNLLAHHSKITINPK